MPFLGDGPVDSGPENLPPRKLTRNRRALDLVRGGVGAYLLLGLLPQLTPDLPTENIGLALLTIGALCQILRRVDGKLALVDPTHYLSGVAIGAAFPVVGLVSVAISWIVAGSLKTHVFTTGLIAVFLGVTSYLSSETSLHRLAICAVAALPLTFGFLASRRPALL